MSTLGSAITLASREFIDKLDKGRKPYILHCIHVMNEVAHYGDNELMIIGVLHDVVEDTRYTLGDLKIMMFSDRVIEALRCLTHLPDVPYEEYIGGIKGNSDAVIVKLADLKHNMDLTRIRWVEDKDLKRVKKYHDAYLCLSN